MVRNGGPPVREMSKRPAPQPLLVRYRVIDLMFIRNSGRIVARPATRSLPVIGGEGGGVTPMRNTGFASTE